MVEFAGSRKQVRHALPMADGATQLTTSRLRLVPATRAMIAAELKDPDRLGEILEAEVAPDWPPEHHDSDTLRFWEDALTQPAAAG